MAKVISQQTFDEVVRENMEEFDMSVDEALAEAVQQFESQVSTYTHCFKSVFNCF